MVAAGTVVAAGTAVSITAGTVAERAAGTVVAIAAGAVATGSAGTLGGFNPPFGFGL